jgi:hypothetical protein
MIFLNKTRRRIAFALISFLLLLILSCNVAREDGHTYINVQKDTAWEAFDSLEITWKDSVSGAEGTLFDGNPADLAATNKLLADGYQGRKIVVTFKGYKDKTLAYEERRTFDGADPAKVTKEIIPIVTGPVDGPKVNPRPRSPKLSNLGATPGSIVSINDFISFFATATLDSGSLKNYAWSYEGEAGKAFYDAASAIEGKSVGIAGGHRYADAGTYHVSLKVATDSDSIAVAQIQVQVLQDQPTADAGMDITVYSLATVKLHGVGNDKLGRIVKTEWKIGAADFAISGSDTTFKAPADAQDLSILFRVTDDDGQVATDTMFVHVIPENESNLTALGVSQGALVPQFAPGRLAYTDTVPNSAASIRLVPEGSGVIKVNDDAVNSGEASDPIDLAVGDNAISVSVQFGTTAAKTYSLKVHRLPVSLNADLSALSVSAGALSPGFSSAETLYAVSVPNATTATTVRATLADTTSTLTVNGFPLASKAVSGSINLAIGKNPITVEVTAQSGGKKSYVVQITRAGNGTPDLSGLTLSAGPLVSAFSPETVLYTLSLPNSVDSTLVTATTGTAASTLAINKQPALSGIGFPVKIPTGVSAITIVVTSPGGEVKTYSIFVTREKNGNADLSKLIPSADTLKPRFDRNTTAYTLAVRNEIGALTPFTLKPEPSAATSTYALTVNGVVVEPADPEAPITLQVGLNDVEIKVRAENGDAKTYRVSVTRAANGDATLSALAVAPGALDSAFAPGDTSYAVAVGNAAASITVTPTTTAAASKITVNGKPVSSGAASEAIALEVGPNGIPVVVTAENLATRTYRLTVTRARNGNTELSGLVPSVGILAPDFQPGIADYGFQAAFSDSLVRITPSAADSHSTIQVNGKAVASGSASEYQKIQVGENANRFIIVITAENLAQKVYNVSVNRAPNSLATLKSLAVSHGTLAQKSALEYADTVSHSTLNVTLTPLASDPNATVTVNSAAVANGSASASIPLAVGDNDIACLVTAQDGQTKTLYTVRVTRLALLVRTRKLGAEISVLDSAEIPLGRPYQQSAPAVTGFHFVNWTTVEGSAAFGDATAPATSVTLSLGDARIQAKYDTNTYTLSVNATNCTVARSPDLAAYNHGKPIILTVTPASGFQFSSWSDGNTTNPRTVALVANTVFTAACTAIPTYTLALAASPAGSGSVSADPAGPTYFTGTSVTLTPNPAAGYRFVNWTGDLTGSAVPEALSMTVNKSVTANFALNQYTLTVTRPPEVPIGCATTPSGSVTVGHGVAKAITATSCKQSVAACGSGTVYLYYDFTGWSSVSGTPVFAGAGSASTTVTLSGDAVIKANYAPPRDECE